MGIQHRGLTELQYWQGFAPSVQKNESRKLQSQTRHRHSVLSGRITALKATSAGIQPPSGGLTICPLWEGNRLGWRDSRPLCKLLFRDPALNANSFDMMKNRRWFDDRAYFHFCSNESWHPPFRACRHALEMKTNPFPPSYKEHTINKDPNGGVLKAG